MRGDNVIVLFRQVYGVDGQLTWYVQYQGPHSVAVENAFGTTVLPTAFNGAADVERVKRAIVALNPGIGIKMEVKD